MSRKYVNTTIEGNPQIIIAVCAFCGRWRDSQDRWHTPPNLVDIKTDLALLELEPELSHTYCCDCLREHSDSHFRGMGHKLAERQEARERENPKTEPDADDPVLLILSLAGA